MLQMTQLKHALIINWTLQNSAGRYAGSNGKQVWITHTEWIKKKKAYQYKWLSNVDSVMNWEEMPGNCIHFWLMVRELLKGSYYALLQSLDFVLGVY